MNTGQKRGCWVLSACLFLVLASFSKGARAQQTDQAGDLRAQLQEFNQALQALRAGDDTVRQQVREAAAILCAQFGRCDVPGLARFYLELPREARLHGMRNKQRVASLRAILSQAGQEGVDGWPALRTDLIEQLRALADEVGVLRDFTPAAQADALRGTLLLGWAESEVNTDRRLSLLRRTRIAAERALQRFDEAGQRTPTLEPRWILGRVHRALGEELEAAEAFRTCASTALEVGQDGWREKALLGLIAMARDRGAVRRVQELISQLASFRTSAESWPLTREHAALLLSQDLAVDSLAVLQNHKPSAVSHRIEWQSHLAMAHARAGQHEAAGQALSTLKEMAPPESALCALTSAALCLEQEDYPGVLTALEGFAPAHAQARVQGLALRGAALLHTGQPGPASSALEEARQLALEWSQTHLQGGGSVVGEWMGVQALVWLAEAHLALEQPKEALQVLESQGANSLRRPGPSPNLSSWAAHFEYGFLSITVGADSGIALAMDKTGKVHGQSIPLGRATLWRAIGHLEQAARAGSDDRARKLGAELARALLPVGLIKNLRASEHPGRLLLILHGPLEALPVQLLVVEGDWLDERATPLVLPALPATEPGSRPALNRAEWLLVGAPLFNSSLHPPLPEAELELRRIGKSLSGRQRYLTGSAFTERALIDALDDGLPLHLATHLIETDECAHGVLSPVGILTSDGVICAGQVFGRTPRLPLAVLNACGTARGAPVDGEGMMGLARAFLAGGTRNVLATLWPIEDQAARRVLESFHQDLQEGFRPSEALTRAQRKLRQEGVGIGDWAAFRLSGRD